jgi:hypothetical protein
MGKPNPVKDFLKGKIDDITKRLLDKHKTSMAENDAHVATLKDVGEIMFGRSGLAVEYLNHFLGGTGTEKFFKLSQLLDYNPTIKERVYAEAARRVLNVKTAAESRMSLKEGKSYLHGLDPCITIYQTNYDDVQWWGALGTFRVNITHPVRNEKRDSFTFLLEGDDEYKWAPDENRPSQTIHRIAQSLVDNEIAKNFPVRGSPMPMSVQGVERLFKKNVTTNPNAKRGLEGSGFTLDQITRCIYIQYLK